MTVWRERPFVGRKPLWFFKHHDGPIHSAVKSVVKCERLGEQRLADRKRNFKCLTSLPDGPTRMGDGFFQDANCPPLQSLEHWQWDKEIEEC